MKIVNWSSITAAIKKLTVIVLKFIFLISFTLVIYALLFFIYDTMPVKIEQLVEIYSKKLGDTVKAIQVTDGKRSYFRLDPISAEKIRQKCIVKDLAKDSPIAKYDDLIFNRESSDQLVIKSEDLIFKEDELDITEKKLLSEPARKIRFTSVVYKARLQLESKNEEGLLGCDADYTLDSNKLDFKIKKYEEGHPCAIYTTLYHPGIIHYDIYEKIGDIETETITKIEENKDLLTGYWQWIKVLPKHLYEISKFATVTLSITGLAFIFALLLVFFSAVRFCMAELESKFEDKSKGSDFQNIIAYLTIPTYILAYMCIPWIAKFNHIGMIKYVLAICVLIIGDGTLSGFYQQIVKITKDEINQKYVTAIRAKGIQTRSTYLNVIRRILWGSRHEPSIIRHVARNAILPILPLINNRIPFLIGGAIVLETIFSIDGLSYYVTEGVGNPEKTDMLLTLVTFSVLFIYLSNFVFSRITIFLDPRNRN
jgi:ABC-type dipeptide/oligopeptide/nickel transport system permease component